MKPPKSLQTVNILDIPMVSRDRLEQKRDIVDVVSEFTELREMTGYFTGLCPHPDHDDKRPSFWVYPDTQRAYCPACAFRGDVVDFLQWVKGMTFDQAIEEGTYDGDADELLQARLKNRWDEKKTESDAQRQYFFLSTRLYYLKELCSFSKAEKIARRTDRIFWSDGYEAASEYLREREIRLALQKRA